jgi:hypothetical protein
MVKHECRENPIERGVGIWQLLRKALVELNRGLTSLGFSAGARQGFGVGVDPHHLGGGIQPLDQDRQVPSAATDFEDSLAWAYACLIDKPSVRRIHAKDLGEQVIEGEKPVFSRGWKIGLFSCVYVDLFLLSLKN